MIALACLGLLFVAALWITLELGSREIASAWRDGMDALKGLLP